MFLKGKRMVISFKNAAQGIWSSNLAVCLLVKFISSIFWHYLGMTVGTTVVNTWRNEQFNEFLLFETQKIKVIEPAGCENVVYEHFWYL